MPDSTLKAHAPLSAEFRSTVIQHLQDEGRYTEEKIASMSAQTLKTNCQGMTAGHLSHFSEQKKSFQRTEEEQL